MNPYYAPQNPYYPAPVGAMPAQPSSITIQLPSAQPTFYGAPVPYGMPYGMPPFPYTVPPGPMMPGPMPGQVPVPGPGPAPAPAGPAPIKLDASKIPGGTVKIIVHQAQKLMDTQCCFNQDPFVRITHGNVVVETETIVGAGSRCTWKDPVYYFGLSKGTGSIRIEVIDWNFFCDEPIGEMDLSIEKVLETFAQPEKKVWFPLNRGGRANAGEIQLTVKYFPPMEIVIHEAAKLYDAQLIGKQDPYVVIKYAGGLALGEPIERRTKVHEDGDKYPKWEESFVINVTQDFTDYYYPGATAAFAAAAEKTTGTGLPQEKKEEKHDPLPEGYLLLQLMDENVVVDAFISYCEIPVSKLFEIRKTGKPGNIELFKGDANAKGKNYGGELTLSVK